MATPPQPPPPPPLVRAPTAPPAQFVAPPFDAPPSTAPPGRTTSGTAAGLGKKGSGVPAGATVGVTASSATAPAPLPPAALGPPPFKPYKRAVRASLAGCSVYVAYLAAFAFYLYVRITKTLGLGRYTAYGAVVLGVECLGATTVLIYGLNLLLLPAPIGPPPAVTSHPYHVRIVVPVYKEALDIVRRTILAARAASLPGGCGLTVYLCDDGRDPKKRAWVAGLGDPHVIYVSGRKRAAGEVNGKSGNINNLLSQLYGTAVTGIAPDKAGAGPPSAGPRPAIPPTELVCVFDADQVCSPEFLVRTLHLFDGGDDVGMVLSPQCFHNLSPHSDIFNHSNVHFWEYSQPGYDALGFISCTGTNFLVRSSALLEVNGSPSWTLTEDYALGMELKRAGWHCRYVPEYLAIGEAPHEVRNIFQQRSRWAKGHFQLVLSRAHCPLFVSGLSPLMRVLYCSGVWSYVVGAVSTPFFMAMPIVTIWAGVFPIVVSWWAAVAISVQYVATTLVLYFVRKPRHLEALWFANVCNSIFWWSYLKASWRAAASAVGAGGLAFKTTIKGASNGLGNSALRDLWMAALTAGGLLASAIAGTVKLADGPTLRSPLAISVLWCVYSLIPPLLALVYGYVARGAALSAACRLAMLASFAAGGLAVFLLFGLYPTQFSGVRALQASGFLFEANQAGVWPYAAAAAAPLAPVAASSAAAAAAATATALAAAAAAAGLGNVSTAAAAAPVGPAVEAADPAVAAFNPPVWRGDALLQERTSGPGGDDISGGWLAGGAAGNLKHAVPTAFSTAMLAWSLVSFPDAHARAGTGARTAAAVRVGADWLMKASGGPASTTNATLPPALVFQVGNWTADRLEWGRPEDIAGPRPAFTAPLAGGPGLETGGPGGAGDLAGSMAGALAAAALALRGADPAYAAGLRARAAALHAAGEAAPGLYRAALFTNTTTPEFASAIAPLYALTTAQDKLLWSAAWLYRATGDARYLKKASEAFARFLYQEGAGNEPGAPPRAPALTPDQLFWGASIALAESAGWATYHERARTFLRSWICAEGERVRYTPRGRVYNVDAPTLGATAAAGFAAAVYARATRTAGSGMGAATPEDARLAARYECFALSQFRYALGGDAGGGGSSFVSGLGRGGGPTRPQHQGASCPAAPAECDAVTAQLTPAPNPWTLYGALVEGPGFSDTASDVRPLNASRVGLDNQAGWAALSAAVAAPGLGKWETCLQGMGVVSRDTLVCG